ncbi:4'-phosphopantetheinyl transferase family protein [Streptomyces sp. DSM 40750]|uniref:4'-phosphopantetheinyl transferase family protein n=1 Tax=Streptomyces sp. DSM 40750 TaxID=2801030 RepID=UPI00214AA86B|nr:4'-phosphopantetheinyl transferase superfamily protein [Streptomyces sp. DSM 40750]UUU22848.1 4'-phosphopantetheinyl transferase superfamily protein [Streptomyces sp. DSM 40750]
MNDSRGRLAATGAVHVWHGRVPDECTPDDLALLDDEELRLVRGRRPPLQAHYAGAHAVLRRLLADHYLGGPPGAIRFGRHICPACGDRTHGRPRIVRPATSLEFSLSRSGPHWALAVTAGGNIGVDIESGHDFAPEGVSELALSDLELARLRALEHEDDRRQFFLRSWTRKEAVLKAVGIGIVTDLRALDVLPAEAGAVVVEHTGPGPRGRWLVEEVDLGPGLVAALARKAGRGSGPVVLRGLADAREGTVVARPSALSSKRRAAPTSSAVR